MTAPTSGTTPRPFEPYESDGQMWATYRVAKVEAAVAALAEAVALLARDRERQEAALALFRREGFVFDDKEGRWQKLAFTLYTDLVESAQEAEHFLAAHGAGEEKEQNG